ncbi:PAS domain-containing protein [Methylobacterium iners]|uniref:PAS domain-containing protein n=1 Tax=Methylobacterium iners TaxID=418707 RepID=A0ABQ4S795_9HYPH|nr:PAS domain-containing protein [Methylobacterium iners]GJD97668.1 hypothetical protein OCOJLMKI_4901 [Methylobacterium iners]
MTLFELIRAFVDKSPVAVLVTDATVRAPGPIILYANGAFGKLTGRDPTEVIGISPRFMQGRETRRPVLDHFAQALAAGEPFHGFLTNYRADGTKYVVEIDCRPLRNADGRIEHFLSFEREVARRLGRPSRDGASRFEPVEVSNDLLGEELRRLRVFSAAGE